MGGYTPVWNDILRTHESAPLHCMVNGGDQVRAFAFSSTQQRGLPPSGTCPNAGTRATTLVHTSSRSDLRRPLLC